MVHLRDVRYYYWTILMNIDDKSARYGGFRTVVKVVQIPLLHNFRS